LLSVPLLPNVAVGQLQLKRGAFFFSKEDLTVEMTWGETEYTQVKV
jgi:hypothetical protein